ncbi:helix-turn-helix domain-containing protein [Paractinoplanes rhizophilus]|uniref:Helix-turn-helix domain-containing protein n=1 Tax=Paractinoplanes rhizophilus TaxID=1416877 RepID=A0ABW2HQK6_9ACTN
MVNGVQIARRRTQLGLTQEQLAERAGIALDTLCRLEQGRRTSARLSTLDKIARALQVETAAILICPTLPRSSSTAHAPVAGAAGVSEMKRRDLLRLVSAATAAISFTPLRQRPTEAANRPLDATGLAELMRTNRKLWADFATASSKTSLYPRVHRQLSQLITALQRPQRVSVRRDLHAATADTFQLAGEVMFDADRYSDAAQCYTLAATAAREANAWDLWSCALTRHAYISLYEERSADAVPLLELAVQVARRGDPARSTRHWAAAVLAQSLAAIGDHAGCERALENAERVTGLSHPYPGGWLRFDGSRLPEDRAACYLKQQQSHRAEPLLNQLLAAGQPGRRRGITLVDLAVVGTQHKDPLRVVTHGFAALDHARNTGSGVIVRRLHNLRPHLVPMRSDPHVRHLDEEIAQLTAVL